MRNLNEKNIKSLFSKIIDAMQYFITYMHTFDLFFTFFCLIDFLLQEEEFLSNSTLTYNHYHKI